MIRYWVSVEDEVYYEKNVSSEPLILFRWDEGFLDMTYMSRALARL